MAEGIRIDGDRSTGELVRSIASDTATLVRKEVQLARQELVEGFAAKAKGAAAMAVAAFLLLFVVIFLGSAAASALDIVLPPWASRLVVAGGFLLVALAVAAIGMSKMKQKTTGPEETKRTVKEDLEWARAQLKR